MTASSAQKGTFGTKVAGVFSTKVVAFVLSFATTLIVSRILGRDGRGAYVNLLSVSGLAGAIGVFGLPNAVNYFSARNGSVRALLAAGLAFTTILSAVLIAVLWLLMPWLQTNIFSDAAAYPDQLHLMLAVIPAALLTTFTTAVLFGRQQVRTYSTILIAQGVLTFAVATTLVGVFRLGVPGAVVATLVVIWTIAIADVVAVLVLARRQPGGNRVPFRSITAYGLRIYPASITGYFNYRIDTYLIPILLVGQASELGLYSIGVTMAELLFYVPDSVTTVFLPRVAGLSHDEAKALLGRVSRLTVLLTALVALAIVPTAWIGIHLVLPAFVGSLGPCYVLLPAVMALSLGKVMSSYIAGRGRPGPISVGSTIAVAVNVAANIVLIPRFGIMGAALASLISYSVSTIFMLNVACRISDCSFLSLIVPTRLEVAFLMATTRRALARTADVALRRGRKTPSSPEAAADDVAPTAADEVDKAGNPT